MDAALYDDVLAHDPDLTVVWTGHVYTEDGLLTAIVQDRGTGRRYVWPSLTAYRWPLPSEQSTRPNPKQLSLFQ